MKKTITDEIYKKLKEAKYLSAVNPDKSYEISFEAYTMSRKHNLKIEEGYALTSMAFAYRAKSKINNMLECSLKALEIFEEEEDISGQAKASNIIGIAYFYSSMYEDALKYFLRTKELYSNIKDDFLFSCVLNNIGEVYRESGIYNKALEYYFEALEVTSEKEYILNTASIYSNIGEIYYAEEKYYYALKYFTKSYDILINKNDMVTLGEVENKLGKVYFNIGNHIMAEEYFIYSLSRLDNLDNKYYAVDVLVSIAGLNLERDIDKSLYYYDKALNYAESLGAKKKLCDVYKLISQLYEKKNNYKTALLYYKKYDRIGKEISALNLGNKLEILRIELGHYKDNDKFENVKKRLENEILKQRAELEKTKESNGILEKKAYEDELSGIPNRRAISRHISSMWQSCKKNSEEVILFMIDIDNFKRYNDFWGHSKGDECLKKVAVCINEIKEAKKEIFGRYGGEEFVYFAKGLNCEQALELGNLIREEVEKLGMHYIFDDEIKITTISVGGVLGRASDINSFEKLLEESDKQLYRAKEAGRNKTFIKCLSE